MWQIEGEREVERVREQAIIKESDTEQPHTALTTTVTQASEERNLCSQPLTLKIYKKGGKTTMLHLFSVLLQDS